MAISEGFRLPRSNIHEQAAQQAFNGEGTSFISNSYSVSGDMPKIGAPDPESVATPGEVTAGAKGALTVQKTRSHLNLLATGKAGSSIDFLKMQ